MLLPLKQGLKHGLLLRYRRAYYVVMLLPLKQGLKPGRGIESLFVPNCCYATSIKTRIETFPVAFARYSPPRCYATSIKTRIETP